MKKRERNLIGSILKSHNISYYLQEQNCYDHLDYAFSFEINDIGYILNVDPQGNIMIFVDDYWCDNVLFIPWYYGYKKEILTRFIESKL